MDAEKGYNEDGTWYYDYPRHRMECYECGRHDEGCGGCPGPTERGEELERLERERGFSLVSVLLVIDVSAIVYVGVQLVRWAMA